MHGVMSAGTKTTETGDSHQFISSSPALTHIYCCHTFTDLLLIFLVKTQQQHQCELLDSNVPEPTGRSVLTSRSVVGDTLQLLDDVDVQQLKGQKILEDGNDTNEITHAPVLVVKNQLISPALSIPLFL